MRLARWSPGPAATCATWPRRRWTGSPRSTGETWTEIDVTADVELERDYGDRVPVVLLDGKEHGYWRVEEDRLLRDLRSVESVRDATHLVWDWNGTLLNDVDLVVSATNRVFAQLGGPVDHRRRAPAALPPPGRRLLRVGAGRAVDADEFDRLDRIFHDAYRAGLTTCALADDAAAAMRPGRAASRCCPCGSTKTSCRP